MKLPAVWGHSQELQFFPHCLGNTAQSQSAGTHFACKLSIYGEKKSHNEVQIQQKQKNQKEVQMQKKK